MIHLADVSCRKLHIGSGDDDLFPTIDESVLDRFNLGERGISTLRAAVEEEIPNTNSFYSGLGG